MEKIDARKLSFKVQQHNRNLAIRLFQQGQKRAAIAAVIGVHYNAVCRWIKLGSKAMKQR